MHDIDDRDNPFRDVEHYALAGRARDSAVINEVVGFIGAAA